MIEELIRRNRSYRRFEQETPVAEETLRELVNLARLSPSAANLQPLKYLLSCKPESNQKIFDTLRWAGYLKDWPGPAAGERPAAYIIILADTTLYKDLSGGDHGIAAQSILLGAAEKRLGGCIVASIDREKLARVLQLPERYRILLAIALGKPRERVVIEKVEPQGDIRYYRTPDGVHHVPKRALDELIFAVL